MALAETEVEVRAWLDRLAIQDLIYRHSDAVTRADWRQCEALYVPDVIWELPKHGLRFDTRAAFMEMLEATSMVELMIQTPHAPVITLIEPDSAQATTTIHEWIRGVSPITGEQTNFEAYGVYFDDV